MRILDKTPRNERRVLVENIGRGLPDLQLRLTEGGPRASATPTTAIPSPFDGRVQIVQRRPPEQDSVLFDLGDGEVLDATVRTPSIPGFITGLWASTLLFLVISITLLGVWAGRALSAPLSAFARAAESFSLSRSSAPLPESGPEEIRSAAKALNLMRNRITSLMNDRTRMLAAISHDLRTHPSRGYGCAPNISRTTPSAHRRCATSTRCRRCSNPFSSCCAAAAAPGPRWWTSRHSFRWYARSLRTAVTRSITTAPRGSRSRSSRMRLGGRSPI
ncbi:HAMP domain-containing protein [Bradyrhizobium diazoefficiens]